MNFDSQHNLMDQIAYYRQNVLKARRLRNICLRQSRRMFMHQDMTGINSEPPTFMDVWWNKVHDLHVCAVELEDNYTPFLGTLRHYRERAKIQFKV